MALFGKVDAALPFLSRLYQVTDDELREFIGREIRPEEELRAGLVPMDLSSFPPGVIDAMAHKSIPAAQKLLPLCRSLMNAAASGVLPSSLQLGQLEKAREEWLMPMYFIADDYEPLTVLWRPREGVETPGLEEAPLPDASYLDEYLDGDGEVSIMIEHHFDLSFLPESDGDEQEGESEQEEALKRIRAAWIDPLERVTYADMYAPFLAKLLNDLQDVVESKARVSRCDECRSAFIVTRAGQKFCSHRCSNRVAQRRTPHVSIILF